MILLCSALLGACDRDAPSAASSAPNPTPHATLSAVPASAPSAVEPLHRVGAAARAPDYTLTVEKVEECKVARFFRPRRGHVKLGVALRVEATGDKLVPVNGFYARITDSDGYTYSPTLGGCDPALPIRRLEKGQKVSGFITFEIPEKATGLTLSYNPYMLGSMKQELRFRLPR